MRKLFLSVLSVALTLFVVAQDSAAGLKDNRPATGLRAEGKIYVVMAVVLIILIGLFYYLVRLDRKISRLEKGTSSK